MRMWCVFSALVGVSASCGGDPSPATPDAAVDAPVDAPQKPDTHAQTLTHRAGPWTVAAGGERTDLCESWTLNNEEPLYVNTVEMTATAGMHHSNWFFVPDTAYPGADGSWPCRERDFEQGAASALGGVFFAQSTQATREAQRFPAGTGFVVPPHARVIGALHMLNTSTASRPVDLTLTVRTLPRSEVRTRLSPFYLEYGPLNITPHGRSQFDVECAVGARAQMLTGAPFSMRFYYGLAHYHELGATMRVTVVGGPLDGRALYENEARLGDSWARTMEPAVDVTGATALRLSCLYDNTTARTVRYGNGNGEMCIWFGFTDSPFQWAARAPQSATNRPGETRDGVTYNTAPCSEIITLPSRFATD
ncbi:MAG: hypothetical protein U0326_40255 [Polyangiales bacterium]